MIYCGILAVTRDDTVRAFAENHLATEARHLDAIEDVLPATRRSLALPLWRIAGWLTGALPALAGPRAVYAAIEAVETFVYRHYAAQVGRINTLDPHRREPTLQALRTLLEHCREDEIAHRDEAAAKANDRSNARLRVDPSRRGRLGGGSGSQAKDLSGSVLERSRLAAEHPVAEDAVADDDRQHDARADEDDEQ